MMTDYQMIRREGLFLNVYICQLPGVFQMFFNDWVNVTEEIVLVFLFDFMILADIEIFTSARSRDGNGKRVVYGLQATQHIGLDCKFRLLHIFVLWVLEAHITLCLTHRVGLHI